MASLLATSLFFVPILRETIFVRGAGLSAQEIVDKVHLWGTWNWLRLAVELAGWWACVRALISRDHESTRA